MTPMYTAFFTRDTLYEAEAARLVDSLNRLGLPHDVVGIDRRKTWLEASRYTATHICSMMERYPDRAIVQLDADAVVHKYPAIFDALESTDIAIYRLPGGVVANGTVFLAPTAAARAVALRYRNLIAMGAHPQDEQKCLQQALHESRDARVCWLPASYCFIGDVNADDLHGADVVIEHLQASREMAHACDAKEFRRRRVAALAAAR